MCLHAVCLSTGVLGQISLAQHRDPLESGGFFGSFRCTQYVVSSGGFGLI